MNFCVPNDNAIRSARSDWSSFDTLLKTWLCLGCVTLLLAPGARGYSAQFGYIAYWLVAAPLLQIGATAVRRWPTRSPIRLSRQGPPGTDRILRRWMRRNRRCHQARPAALAVVYRHASRPNDA